VTKEKGVHQFDRSKIAYWVINRMSEKYYKTYTTEKNILTQDMKEGQEFLSKLLNSHRHSFIETDEGYLFGSGALLLGDEGFVTTARGKREVEDFAFVSKVDHDQRKVFCVTNKKATLNAPLFHYIFAHLCQPKYILHFHHQREDLKTMEYATPGTDKDSTRPILDCPSFNIEGHGCILSYNKNGELLK